MLKEGTVERNLINAIDEAVETWLSIVEDIESLEERGYSLSTSSELEKANYIALIAEAKKLKLRVS